MRALAPPSPATCPPATTSTCRRPRPGAVARRLRAVVVRPCADEALDRVEAGERRALELLEPEHAKLRRRTRRPAAEVQRVLAHHEHALQLRLCAARGGPAPRAVAGLRLRSARRQGLGAPARASRACASTAEGARPGRRNISNSRADGTAHAHLRRCLVEVRRRLLEDEAADRLRLERRPAPPVARATRSRPPSRRSHPPREALAIEKVHLAAVREER